MASRELISANRLAWLRREIAAWRSEGLVDQTGAQAIEANCTRSLRARGARTVLLIGAALLAAGLIGVVASSLEVEEIGPLMRSLLVALVWLLLVALAESLRGRGAAAALANPVALLAAVAYGATIFQVTQSLQVSAFEPSLILAWALGSLAYAYGTRDSAPLVLGIGALVGWYAWELAERAEVASAIVLGLALATPLAAAVAAFHEGTSRTHFTGAWRFAAALLALGSLAVATIAPLSDPSLPSLVLIAALPIAVISLVAIASGDERQRAEIAGALVVAAAAVALIALAPQGEQELSFFDEVDLPASVIAHKLVAVGLFLALAAAIAYLGAINGATAMTGVGVGAIVVFFQAQAVALALSIGSTSWLLLALGALLIACGLLADALHRRTGRS